MSIGISTTTGKFENFIGAKSCAMINYSTNNFSIIFQNKEKFQKGITSTVTDKMIFLPLLIFNYKDMIQSAKSNCFIEYNNELNIETILTGFVIKEICVNHDLKLLEDIFIEKINILLNDQKLLENLNPIIENYSFIDDEDFNILSREMYDIVDKRIKELT